MIFWKTVGIVITTKGWHIKKLKGTSRRGIYRDLGEVPTLYFNETTKRFERVVNTRGNAYAKRNDTSYRKTRKRKLYELGDQGDD